VRRALPALAVAVTLITVWPAARSAFHEPKAWVFLGAAVLGAALTLPRWRWSALPLLALTVVQPWHSAEEGVMALAFAWALAAWPSLGIEARQFTRVVGLAAAGVGVIVVLQAIGLDVFSMAGPQGLTSRLRLYGTLGNPDFVASVLLPIGLLSLSLRQRGEGRGEGLLVPIVVLIVAALVLTRSFGTLLAALAAGVVLLLHRRGQGVLAVLGLSALLVVGLLGRDAGRTLAGRRYLVSVALPHVLDAPLFGHGLGATALAWPEWELSYWQARCPDAACVAADPQRQFAAAQDHLHADWLEWLLERGLLGTLALLLALGAPLVAHWRRADPFLLAALAAVLARSLVDFPLHRPADLCLLAALLAQVSPPPAATSPTP